MNIHSIRWRLPLSYAAIALLAALALGTLMILVLNGYYVRMERAYLLGNAVAIQPVVQRILALELPDDVLQEQVTGLSFLSQTQIRVLDREGEPIADSGVPFAKRIVTLSAPAGVVKFNVPVGQEQDGPVVVFRESPDEKVMIAPVGPRNEDILFGTVDTFIAVSASPFGYGFSAAPLVDFERRSSQAVAVPLADSMGVLEISNGPAYGADILRSVATAWFVAGILAIAVAGLAGWYASRAVTRPVLALGEATSRMERGELSARVVLRRREQQEFVALADSFNNMAGRVEETVSTLRAFVADAAHELQTPLTALHTNLELAVDEQEPARKAAFLARAQEQGQRLEDLVNGLLDLSRIETATLPSSAEPVDLNEVLAELAEPFASRAEHSGRGFVLRMPEERVLLRANAEQIRRAVANLLENAFKFTSTGESISLSLERRAHEVHVTVDDSGRGIPAEDLPFLFDRFHRGHNAAGRPGNGLGLAIVQAIAHAHRGRVTATSAGEDQGSAFSMIFPVED